MTPGWLLGVTKVDASKVLRGAAAGEFDPTHRNHRHPGQIGRSGRADKQAVIALRAAHGLDQVDLGPWSDGMRPSTSNVSSPSQPPVESTTGTPLLPLVEIVDVILVPVWL